MPAHADATTAYTKRFDAVLAHIDANLEGDLSVDALSRIANFSKFHFFIDSSPPMWACQSRATCN
ncbi:hypothetical protein [Paraburkholderia sp. SG-MS1]|uniref:hypothetical protein n=1 Tax=Paraburkholderia sp. SG-MS1 TaxID=2023741 RepID=UPI00406C4D9E